MRHSIGLTVFGAMSVTLLCGIAPASAGSDDRLQARLSSLSSASRESAPRRPDLVATPVKSYGPSFPTLSDETPPDGGMSEATKQSIGCAVAGTGGTALAVWAGGENLVNVIAGGLVAPANPLVLYTGIAGVVFASFCAIGQALTPLYLHWTETPAAPPPAAGRPVNRRDTNAMRMRWTEASYPAR